MDKNQSFDEGATFQDKHQNFVGDEESSGSDTSSPNNDKNGRGQGQFGSAYKAYFPKVTWSDHSRNVGCFATRLGS